MLHIGPIPPRSGSFRFAKICAGLCLSALLAPGAFAASSTQPSPDLSGYRTVATAISTKITEQQTSGLARTGYLGVVTSNDSANLRVDEIEEGSPAQMAGVEPGDRLLDLDHQPLPNAEALRDALQSHRPGDEVRLGIRRDGKLMGLDVFLRATSRPMKIGGRRALMGVTVGDETDSGAAIMRVTPGLPAEAAGIRAGDVLVKIDGVTLNGSARVSDNLAQKDPGDHITLIYRREGREQEVRLALAADTQNDPRAPLAPTQLTGVWKKDVYHLAVICAEFPDQKHNDKIEVENWDEAFFSTGSYSHKQNITGQPVYGSLNDYYLEQSCGQFRVTGQIFDWVQMSKNRADYAQGSGVNSHTPFLVEATDLLLERDGGTTLDAFDGVLFLFAGDRLAGANRGGLYWPHKGVFQFRGKRLNYFICPEGGARVDSNSVFCHEFGHMLGLPDLYSRPEAPGSLGLGAWCAMSMQAGGGRPQHFSAWCKEQLGWIKPTVIDPTVRQKLILSPIENSPTECYKVLIRSDGSEYLLLENRRKIGFDESLPGEGLLIYRVVNDRPVLEESHGVDGPNGPMVYLTSVPYPSIANTAFTPYTIPSSRSVVGGGLPVYLTNIKRLADGRITFYVGFEYE